MRAQILSSISASQTRALLQEHGLQMTIESRHKKLTTGELQCIARRVVNSKFPKRQADATLKQAFIPSLSHQLITPSIEAPHSPHQSPERVRPPYSPSVNNPNKMKKRGRDNVLLNPCAGSRPSPRPAPTSHPTVSPGTWRRSATNPTSRPSSEGPASPQERERASRA